MIPIRALTACVIVGAAWASVRADTTSLFASPTDDRWHYPFNFTPGNRSVGSTFGTVGDLGPNMQPRFNDRDGVLIFGFDTSGQITPGLGAESYIIKSMKLTITHVGGTDWLVDLTPDEWFTYDFNADGMVNADGFPRGHAMDTDGESDDVDPGRPFELFGAGFAEDGPFDEDTWTETSIFIGWNQQPSPVARNPFPFVYLDDTPAMLHVEDNIKGLHNAGLGVGQFTPQPWATGEPIGYVPGATPDPFDVEFDVNLDESCGLVRGYFQASLDRGRVIVIVTSLFETSQQASDIPEFFLNNTMGNPHPARLEIFLADHPIGDVDGDGDVDHGDAALLASTLVDPDSAAPDVLARADVDGSGTADGGDVQRFVNVFLGGCN